MEKENNPGLFCLASKALLICEDFKRESIKTKYDTQGRCSNQSFDGLSGPSWWLTWLDPCYFSGCQLICPQLAVRSLRRFENINAYTCDLFLDD